MKNDSQGIVMLRAFVATVVASAILSLPSGPMTARADEAPPDSAKAAGEAKAAEAKEHAEEAKAAGEAKAAEAQEHATEAKEAGQAKAAEAKEEAAEKAAAKGKDKTKKAKGAKGGAVSEGTKAAPGTMPVKPSVEPQRVQVQHILIAFAGSGTRATRTKDEAKKLAYEVLERARQGEDFDALVKQYTDDSPPGIYGMSGRGTPPAAGEHARDGMVPAFGNVGFAISAGNIGMADHDPVTSPYGWHIIKRLK